MHDVIVSLKRYCHLLKLSVLIFSWSIGQGMHVCLVTLRKTDKYPSILGKQHAVQEFYHTSYIIGILFPVIISNIPHPLFSDWTCHENW